MHRLIFLLAMAAACAPPPAVEGSNSAPRRATIFTSPETGTLMTEAARASTTEIAAPPEAVWLAVKKVYADFDIPVTLENLQGHQLGNPNFFKSRTMGGQSMSMYIDCGTGMTGPNASSWRIYMSLLTDVNPDGTGGTKLQTTFTALGQNVSAGSADRIPCGTNGRFEENVLSRVKAALGK
jgi:hypothetical protein